MALGLFSSPQAGGGGNVALAEMLQHVWDLACLVAIEPRLKSGPLVTDGLAPVGGTVARWEHAIAGVHVPAVTDFGDSLPTRETRTAFAGSVRFTDDGLRAQAGTDVALTGLYVLLGCSMLTGNNGERIVRMSTRAFADTGHTLEIDQNSPGNITVSFPFNDGGYALSAPMDGTPFVVELVAGLAGSRYMAVYDSAGVRATQGFNSQAYLGSNYGGLTVGAYNANQADQTDCRVSVLLASSSVPDATMRTRLLTGVRRAMGHSV